MQQYEDIIYVLLVVSTSDESSKLGSSRLLSKEKSTTRLMHLCIECSIITASYTLVQHSLIEQQ
jgi:hypothetical protein